MILYHFTAAEHLASIRRDGLNQGQVPVSSTQIRNGVWLTTDGSRGLHGLPAPAQIPLEEIRAAKKFGMLPADHDEAVPLWGPDKRAIRIRVKVPSTDTALKRWTVWGPRHVEQDWYDDLNTQGGGLEAARTWYVCFRTIAPDAFIGIDALQRTD